MASQLFIKVKAKKKICAWEKTFYVNKVSHEKPILFVKFK